MNKDWFIIINPKAGNHSATIIWPKILELLTSNNVLCDYDFTEYRYNALEIVIGAIKKGYRNFISVGGDGTLHEVVNGFFIQSEVPVSDLTLAIFPLGSGNDWARMHGISSDLDEFIKIIKNNKYIYQDVGVISYEDSKVLQTRYMINGAGSGFDANVCFESNKIRSVKKDSTRKSYLSAIFRALLSRRPSVYKVYVDGELFYSGNVFSLALGIGKYSGAGIIQIPDAKLDDGLLNLVIFKPCSIFYTFSHLHKLFNGEAYLLKNCLHTTFKELEIKSEKKDRVEVDGEVLGTTDFRATIIKKILRICVK